MSNLAENIALIMTFGDRSFETTVLRLRKNGFQNASEGDVRRLVLALEVIRSRNLELETALAEKKASLESALNALNSVLQTVRSSPLAQDPLDLHNVEH